MMATERVPPHNTTALPEVRLRHLLACIAILLMPFPLILRGLGDPKLAYDYNTIIFPVDVALVAVILSGARSAVGRGLHRTLAPGTALWSLFCATMTIALVAHPSLRGAHTVFELWGCAFLADTIIDGMTGDARPLLMGTVAAVAGMETVWSGLQLLTHHNLGLHALGEDLDPFFRFSPAAPAPMGSLVHIYVLCGLALVSAGLLTLHWLPRRRGWLWLVAAAVALIPVGYTYSRAGLLGAVLLLGMLAIGALWALRDGIAWRYVVAVAVLSAAVTLPGVAWSQGWTNRAAQTTTATSASALTTQRGTLTDEALRLIRHDPVVGVGPGRYVITLRHRFHQESDTVVRIFKPVHNIPLLVAAEGGVLAGLLVVGLLLVLGWRAARSGPGAVALYLAYLPFVLLDHFPYSFPQGLVITTIWLAALDVAGTLPGIDVGRHVIGSPSLSSGTAGSLESPENTHRDVP